MKILSFPIIRRKYSNIFWQKRKKYDGYYEHLKSRLCWMSVHTFVNILLWCTQISILNLKKQQRNNVVVLQFLLRSSSSTQKHISKWKTDCYAYNLFSFRYSLLHLEYNAMIWRLLTVKNTRAYWKAGNNTTTMSGWNREGDQWPSPVRLWSPFSKGFPILHSLQLWHCKQWLFKFDISYTFYYKQTISVVADMACFAKRIEMTGAVKKKKH